MDEDAVVSVPQELVAALARASFRARHSAVLFALLANSHREALSGRFLEKATGLARRTVRTALDDLSTWRVIAIEQVRGRSSRVSFCSPAVWDLPGGRDGAPTGGRTAAPTLGGRTGAPTSPSLGGQGRPLVGGQGRPKKREIVVDLSLYPDDAGRTGAPTSAVVSDLVDAANRVLAEYPHPTTRSVRRVENFPSGVMACITQRARQSGEPVAELVGRAIDGYVVRCGLGIQEPSGWDAWKYFEPSSLLSDAKIDANLAAEARARELGNERPYRRGDDTRRRRPRPPEARPTTEPREVLSAEALEDGMRANYEAQPDSTFMRARRRRMVLTRPAAPGASRKEL